MQVHVTRPTVVTRVTLADAIRESTATGLDEVLRSRTVPVVSIIAVPCHTSAPTHLIAIPFSLTFVAGIKGCGLGLSLTLVIASSTSTTSREITVVHVIGIGHEGVAHRTEGFHCCQTQTIAIVGTITQIWISLYTVAGTALGDELECEVIITIVDTRHTRQVALIVVGLYLIDYIRGQVLHHGIVITRHEVATVEFELTHFLTIDTDLAIVVDLCTWEGLHQCFDDRTFWYTESISIIHHRIVADHHLRQIGGNHCFVELHGTGFHRDSTYSEVPTPFLVDCTIVVLVAKEGYFH